MLEPPSKVSITDSGSEREWELIRVLWDKSLCPLRACESQTPLEDLKAHMTVYESTWELEVKWEQELEFPWILIEI